MRAVVYEKNGTPDVLQVDNNAPLPIFQPGRKSLLVKVHASSINPVDWKLRLIKTFGTKFPVTPGADFAGEVVKCDANSAFKVGDKVFGMLPLLQSNGANAEYIIVKEAHASLSPSKMSFVEASCIPLVALTVWQSFVRAGITKLPKGEALEKIVLIHAGAGGVGTIAIQISKALGLKVYTTCSTKNVEFCKGLGADHVIDYTTTGFDTIGVIYDYIFDTMGGDYELRGMKCISPKGLYINVMNSGWATKFASGKTDGVSGADNTIGTIVGFAYCFYRICVQYAIGPYYVFAVVKPDGKMLTEVRDFFEKHGIKPIVDKIYPLEKIRDAHSYMEIGHARGKVVIDFDAIGDDLKIASSSKL